MSDNIGDHVIGPWALQGPRPNITGDRLRSIFEIVGFEVGATRVDRRSGEPLYTTDGYAGSLLSRALPILGTTEPWVAVYRD